MKFRYTHFDKALRAIYGEIGPTFWAKIGKGGVMTKLQSTVTATTSVLLFVVVIVTIIVEGFKQLYEPPRDKTNKVSGAQRRLRSAWASAQSDQSLRCPHEESLGP